MNDHDIQAASERGQTTNRSTSAKSSRKSGYVRTLEIGIVALLVISCWQHYQYRVSQGHVSSLSSRLLESMFKEVRECNPEDGETPSFGTPAPHSV